jgi:catechol 2,3-dioxygenase-like lactoylglutathione lyase family enzyme
MISFKRVDHTHICVPAERLEEARHFYTHVIGLKEMHRPVELGDEGIWFTAANIELHIGVEEPLPATIRHTAFEVIDLEAARQHLLTHGVVIQPQRVLPGRSRFSFIDPFGNRMELLEME